VIAAALLRRGCDGQPLSQRLSADRKLSQPPALGSLSGTLKPIWIGRLGLHGNLSQRDLLAGLPSVALIMTVPAGSPGTSAKPTFVPFGTASAER